MRLEAVVMFDDMDIQRFKLNKPSKRFKLKYKIDNKQRTLFYNYTRDKIYTDTHLFLFKKKCLFYKHGNPNPLDYSLVQEEYDSEQLNTFLESQLLKDIGNSTKNKGLEMSIGLVLGLAGILAIVLIAILG